MKLQDVLTHGEKVSAQLCTIDANQQALVSVTGRVKQVGKGHNAVFHIGSLSLFGGIEVEEGRWYTYCVTATDIKRERVLTGWLQNTMLTIWQRDAVADVESCQAANHLDELYNLLRSITPAGDDSKLQLERAVSLVVTDRNWGKNEPD